MRPVRLTLDIGPSGVGTPLAVALPLLAAVGVLIPATGSYGLAGLALVVCQDLPVTAAIFLAAGGWGWLAVHRLVGPDAGAGLLAVTSVAVGLWMLSTALLIVGSLGGGGLAPALWWTVVAAGVVLTAWAGRKRLVAFHPPERLPLTVLLGVLGGAAAGLFLAGAAMPAGTVGLVDKDFYDVVSYHLQIPREFHLNGRIGPLPHNTYSHYPLGGEMLFLLAMILKGGAWAGVYAAKFTHGLWGVLAAAAIYFGCPADRPWRRRAATLLAVCTPAMIYLSWLAFVELSQLAYMAVAVAWLIRWLRKPAWRSAVLTGLACGGACATKYLSVGFVAGPVLAVMLVASLRSPRRAAQAIAAAAACLALFSPWLIRNAAETGNPVFPLATGVFGAGRWSAEQTQRWNAGHAPPSWSQRPAAFVRPFVSSRGFTLGLSALAAVAAAITAIRPRRAARIDRACAAILALQLAVWVLLTHMPGRFLLPAVAPMCLLAGGLIERLVRWGEATATRPAKSWTPPAAAALLVIVAVAGLLSAGEMYQREQAAAGAAKGPSGLHGHYPDELAALPVNRRLFEPLAGGRLLMIGDIRPFAFPANTLYASGWEMDVLTGLLRQTRDGEEIIRRLRRDWAVTHVWIDWNEIARLRRTYGWWPDLDRGVVDSLIAAGARDLLPSAPPGVDGQGPGVQMLELPGR